MPRYRDMTDQELVDTAKDWVTPHPATSRLLHAVTSRLEALAGGAQAETPAAPKTRCRSWLEVRKARGLSPEARKWLRNHPDASVRSRYQAALLPKNLDLTVCGDPSCTT